MYDRAMIDPILLDIARKNASPPDITAPESPLAWLRRRFAGLVSPETEQVPG